MDRRFREIQRRIAGGDLEAIAEFDRELLRSGHYLIGVTDQYGTRPGAAVFLAPLPSGLWAIVMRDYQGNLDYHMEEKDTPGEHIGEYTTQNAKKLAKQILDETKATWATDDTVCPDPRCASKGRAIIESSRSFGTSVAWEPPEVELQLRCVECGHKWVDYGGGLFRKNPDEKIQQLQREIKFGDRTAAKALIRQLARTRQDMAIYEVMQYLETKEDREWAANQYWVARGIHDPHWWYAQTAHPYVGYAIWTATKEEAEDKLRQRGFEGTIMHGPIWMKKEDLKYLNQKTLSTKHDLHNDD